MESLSHVRLIFSLKFVTILPCKPDDDFGVCVCVHVCVGGGGGGYGMYFYGTCVPLLRALNLYNILTLYQVVCWTLRVHGQFIVGLEFICNSNCLPLNA